MSSKPIGFWGLVVEPGKMYSQKVPVSFKITMAALGPDTYKSGGTKPSRSIVMLTHQKDGEFALCSLLPEKHDQQTLDIVFLEGETIHLRVIGENQVHLTGYYVEDAEENNDPYGGYDSEEMDAEMNGVDLDEDDSENDDEYEETDSDGQDENDYEETTDSEMGSFIDDGSEEDEEEDEKYVSSNPRIREIKTDEEDNSESDKASGVEQDLVSSNGEADTVNVKSKKQKSKPIISEPAPSKKIKTQQPNLMEKVSKDLEGKHFEAKQVENSKKTETSKKVESPKSAINSKVKEETPVKAAETKKVETPKGDKKAESVKESNKAVVPVTNNNVTNQSQPSPTGVKTLPSGLKIEDIKLGAGIKAQKGRRVAITYTIIGDSESKDNQQQQQQSLSFEVGDSQILKAISIGIQGMALGGERKLIIPSSMVEQQGAQPSLPKSGNPEIIVKLDKVNPTQKPQ